ncbi:MAG: DUF6456 domain-containing protein [Sulfitobacter sp.]
MRQSAMPELFSDTLPNWVPANAKNYLAHTEAGYPIRALARAAGCHPSTILRQIRRIETRRDDPLVDAALRALGAAHYLHQDKPATQIQKELLPMLRQSSDPSTASAGTAPDDELLNAQAFRILRRLCENGAVLAVATDMDKAVVVRSDNGVSSGRTAVVDRAVAEAMALKDWISVQSSGRITRYVITAAGRIAAEAMMRSQEGSGRDPVPDIAGFAEAQMPFADQHRSWGEKTLHDADSDQPRRVRYNLGESPLTSLARRRGKDGAPFLDEGLVRAGERLREDFELAQMGPRIAQNWDRFVTPNGRGGFAPDSGVGDGPSAARKRVSKALGDLGPGLSDVVLRCCCYLEGLETAEKRLGWSARSGKIVLRIALMRLKRHYDETTGAGGPMIG